MHQKGFILLPILVGAVVIALTGTVIYFSRVIEPAKPLNNNQQEFTLSPSPTPGQTTNEYVSAFQRILDRYKKQPTPSPSPSLQPTKSPTPKPSVGISPTPTSTSTPTSTPTPTVKKNTCDINVIYGKLGGGASDPKLVTLVYSFSGHNNVYMIGAQWDFEGDGNWNTDMKQSNGTIEHTYNNEGSYTAKLRVQGSDGSITDTCSKSLTVPSGITVRLTGKVYADINCNNIPEPNEKGVSGVTVNIFKKPESYIYATVTTDGDGNYSFSQNIQVNDSLSVQPADVAAPGYKIYYSSTPTFALGSGQPSINHDRSQVPVESLGSCPPY